MTIAKTVKQLKGPKFLVVIPKEIRDLLELQDSDFVELSIKKIAKNTQEQDKEVSTR